MADGNTQLVVRQGSMLPANLAEASQMAEDIARSGLFGVKNREEALALMLLADAEGLHPAAAARDYHIIQGRPALRADAMLARFQSAGGSVEWVSRDDECVEAIFRHHQGGECPVKWDMERASKIKSWNKKDQKWEALTDKLTWQNYPRQMLTARCISEGVRTVFPGVAVGIYTPEEVQDFEPQAPAVPVAEQHEPEAPQTASKAKSRALYEELQNQLRNHEGEEWLRDWGKRNKPRIDLLPEDWRKSIYDEYAAEMRPLVMDREAQEYAEKARLMGDPLPEEAQFTEQGTA